MRVLSLFDGIAGAKQALKELRLDCEYLACEIDKYAIQVAKTNHPDITHLGDVKSISVYPPVDLLIGGSPCQDLSIAKKDRQGLAGERSGLFYEYVRILKEAKPKFFVLENVASMTNDAKNAMTKELFGVEPVTINSSLLTAQQRKRHYWVGELQQDGTYKRFDIPQPKDKGLLLKDILENGLPYQDKSYALTASYKGADIKNSLEKNQRTMIAEPICVAQRGRYVGEKTEQKLEPNYTNKTNTLTSVSKDNLILEPVRIGQILKGGQGGRIYSVVGKSVCLSANGGGGGAKTGLYKINLPDGDYYIRKLTPTECARLQGFPDNYHANISDTQAYKCYGNSFTVPVIKHILRHIFIFKKLLDNKIL